MSRMTEVVPAPGSRLTVLSRDGLYVQCRCMCGTVKRFRVDGVRTGTSRSCGCLLREVKQRCKKLTEDQVTELVEVYRLGYSVTEIAQCLGVSKKVVQGQLLARGETPVGDITKLGTHRKRRGALSNLPREERLKAKSVTERAYYAKRKEEGWAPLALPPCLKCGSTERDKRGKCAPCKRQTARNRYAQQKVEDPGFIAAHNARAAAWRATPKGQLFVKEASMRRARELRFKQYGITPEQFLDMLDAQGGKCAICKEPLRPGKYTHVDHDHNSGKVRELLCNLCNVQLPRTLYLARAAVAYLEKHR